MASRWSSLPVDRDLYEMARNEVIRSVPIPIYFKDQIGTIILDIDRKEHFVDLDRNPKCICPFHDEKTPSFRYVAEENYWRCFGKCQDGGTVIELHMRKFGILNHFEALWNIRERFGKKYGLKFENFFVLDGASNRSVVDIIDSANKKKEALSLSDFINVKAETPTLLAPQIENKLAQLKSIDIFLYTELCIEYDGFTVDHKRNTKTLTEFWNKIKVL